MNHAFDNGHAYSEPSRYTPAGHAALQAEASRDEQLDALTETIALLRSAEVEASALVSNHVAEAIQNALHEAHQARAVLL
ncbi:hypothetical protein ACSMXM_05640 [Pacificimonas sp. ICDLI1SI03]